MEPSSASSRNGDGDQEASADTPFGDVPAISKSLAQLQEELQDLRSATEHIDVSKDAAQKAAEAAEGVRSASETLVEANQSLIERLDAVDLPARLDGLEEAVQDVQREISGLESSLSDRQEKIGRAIQSQARDLETLSTRVIAGLIIVGLIALAAVILPIV